MASRIVVAGTRGAPGIAGGVETHVENLYPRLAAMGFDITICCRSCYVDPNNRIDSFQGCKLKYINTPRRKSLEAFIHTLKSVLYAKSIHADLIHIHAIGPAILIPLARLLGLRVIFTHHGPDYQRGKWGRVARSALRLGEIFGCRNANTVIAISAGIRDIALRYSKGRVELVPNGVVSPIVPSTQHVLQRNGIRSKKYVLSVARFVEEKGLHDLLEAFEEEFSNEWQLVIAGDSDHETEYSRALKRRAASIPSVVLTGYLKGVDLAEIYANAALFVLPSYHEGLPIALLEAMSYSLPVLVSDIVPHIEVGLEENSYFHVGDAKDLKRKIREHLGNIGERPNYREMLNYYDWDSIAAKTAEIYNSVLADIKHR
jgi:Glycosyltransferase